MGIIRLLACVLGLAGLADHRAAAQAPHLSGRISVSVRQGTIAADLELSRLPPLANARLWLHTGLNVEAFRDSTGRRILAQRRTYAPDTTEEAWQYQLLDAHNQPRPLPRCLRLRYAGAFPVQADSSQYPDRGDDKGRLAFNGTTVRATEQTAWYPVLYNRALDQEISAYTYDLEVSCADCQTLYLNGSAPAAGPVQRLVSTTPVALVLFAGNYPVQRFAGGWLLNSTLTTGQAATFGGFVDRVRGYYERQLGLPYRQELAFLNSTPVSRRDGWLFVTFPTIATVGWHQDVSTLFRGETLADSALLPYLSHEFGHYYFGTLLQPNAALRNFFLEGTTEYLALKATQRQLGPKPYREKLAEYRRRLLRHGDFKALGAIGQASELDDAYRYVAVPLQLLALEQLVGEKPIWRWLRAVVQAAPPRTDYAFLLASLRQSGLREADLTTWLGRYTGGGPAMQQALLALTLPPPPQPKRP